MLGAVGLPTSRGDVMRFSTASTTPSFVSTPMAVDPSCDAGSGSVTETESACDVSVCMSVGALAGWLGRAAGLPLLLLPHPKLVICNDQGCSNTQGPPGQQERGQEAQLMSCTP